MTVLGLRHEVFVENVIDVICSRFRDFSSGKSSRYRMTGQEVANTIWAVATTNMPVDEEVMDLLTSYVTAICSEADGSVTLRGIAKIFNRQELANIAWSCAVLDIYPDDLMALLYLGLVGVGEEPSDEYILPIKPSFYTMSNHTATNNNKTDNMDSHPHYQASFFHPYSLV